MGGWEQKDLPANFEFSSNGSVAGEFDRISFFGTYRILDGDHLEMDITFTGGKKEKEKYFFTVSTERLYMKATYHLAVLELHRKR